MILCRRTSSITLFPGWEAFLATLNGEDSVQSDTDSSSSSDGSDDGSDEPGEVSAPGGGEDEEMGDAN